MSELVETPASEPAPDKKSLRQHWVRQHKDHWNAPISEYGQAYFQALKAEYQTLKLAPPPPSPPSPPSQPALPPAAGIAPVPAAAPAAAPAPPAPAGAAGIAPVPAPAPAPGAGGPQTPACCQLTPCERRRAAALVIDELISRPIRQVLWRDLLVMEAMLAKMQSKEAIALELALLRAEYKELVGPEAYESLKLPVVPLPVTEADYPKALAEYETLLQELHWNYLSAPAREEERTNLLVAVTQSLGLLVVVALLIWSLSPSRVLASLIVCGGLGAWLSAFRRAQSPSLHSTVLLNLRRSRWSRLSFSLAPWIGGISAVALAFVFAGGIVTGRFFPTVRWTDHLDAASTNLLRGAADSLATNVVKTGAKITNELGVPTNSVPTNAVPNKIKAEAGLGTASEPAVIPPAPGAASPLQWHANHDEERWWFGGDTEHALLLLWAFLAGFSERLVPDLLNRIAKKTEGAV